MPTVTKPDEAPRIKHQTLISVTQRDLDQSVKDSSSHCILAMAIKNSNPNAQNISVDLQTIRWTDRRNQIRYVWLTPALGQKALIDFDNGEHLAPFMFRLAPHPIAETQEGRPKPLGTSRPQEKKKKRRSVRVRRAGKGAITVTTVGRPLPPIAALPGSRRRFGLRQLQKLAERAKKEAKALAKVTGERESTA